MCVKKKQTQSEHNNGQKMRQVVNILKHWFGSDVGMCTVVQRSKRIKEASRT